MLEEMFNPNSIAVVGASNNREKIGNILVRNIKTSYRGKLYPINLKEPEIEGLKAYGSLKEIGSKVDLVIISVPREAVVDVMMEAGEAGTRAAVIITSGFREVDEKGKELELKIMEVAKKYSIRFLGPNTMGLITLSMNAINCDHLNKFKWLRDIDNN